MELKELLIDRLQTLEKEIGLEAIDNEETLTNMGLLSLFNNFLVLNNMDSSLVIDERTDLLKLSDILKRSCS